jgi:uncharacterized protein YfaS (alpha-2-macroglobulin family)
MFLLRSSTGALVKEGDNEFIFWGQDFSTLKSIDGGKITLYNLEESKKSLSSTTFNKQGIARLDLTDEAEIAVVERGSDVAIVPINLQYFDMYSYKDFVQKEIYAKYFIFTDRPLYRPGDTVHFKAILRNEDDVRYSIPKGLARVIITQGYENEDPLFEKTYQITEDGTIYGEATMPEKQRTGGYRVSVTLEGEEYGGSTYINVENFRKPEYFIDLTSNKTELTKGEALEARVNGAYFSGQPITNQSVKYTAYASTYYDYEFYYENQYRLNDDYRYGSYWGETFQTGQATFNEKGIAEISLDTKLLKSTSNQIISLEAEFIDASGNPSFARKNFLVYAGEYDLYRKRTNSYSAKINQPYTLQLMTVPHFDSNIANNEVTATITSVEWQKFQPKDKKYPEYKRIEKKVGVLTTMTDSKGEAELTITPKVKGSYIFDVQSKDKLGNTISKSFSIYVSDLDYGYYIYNEEPIPLTVSFEKEQYGPNDTATILINSDVENRDVFLSFDRARTDRFQIITLKGKTATVKFPLMQEDMPNMFAYVGSFSDQSFDSDTAKVLVSAESKRINVNIKTNAKKYGPGENATVNIETTTENGTPVSADVALWSVDKALFELVDTPIADIFETYWEERYYNTSSSHSLRGIRDYAAEKGGGCFAEDTLILMQNGKTKKIQDIKVGDFVLTFENEDSNKLVKAKVVGTHSAQEAGYLIINQNLKVTPNHKMFVNRTWQTASNIQKGDVLKSKNGKDLFVHSVEWQKGKFNVYNLEIEKYRTYIADGIYVHNQKGGITREVFKDTAYWNPSIKTDSNGKAQVTFKLPDNLTTWVISSVSSTKDTKVGQGTAEVKVSKNVVVRPILPNIIRTNDSIAIGALVHNFMESEDTFEVSLNSPSNSFPEQKTKEVIIPANSFEYVFWDIKPTQANKESKFNFEAISRSDTKIGDKIIQTLPIEKFGFIDQTAKTGNGNATFDIKAEKDTDLEESSVTLSLSTSLIGSLTPSMKYLIDYPYGCVEQTTSRFVPVVIARSNKDIFSEEIEDKDIDDMVVKGIERLEALQQSDGGWAWWGHGSSNPFISAYVVEYLVMAQKAGFEVDKLTLSRATNFFEKTSYYDETKKMESSYPDSALVAKSYGLTMLGEKEKTKSFYVFDDMTPDIIALAVMNNYLNGTTDPEINGLNKLISMGQIQGDAMYWSFGEYENFGSTDASTALAVRAIVTANGDRETAAKGIKYLTYNRYREYWANTFGTSQVIRAVVDFAKTGNELTPNYTYSIELDNEVIATGNVNNAKQVIKEIDIPLSKLAENGSVLGVWFKGEGQLYSTMVFRQHRTNRAAAQVSKGITIERRYVNDKGPNLSPALGDVVTVQLNVLNSHGQSVYGIIEDQLPAGMIPINTSFKNESFMANANNYFLNTEFNLNGAIIPIYSLAQGQTSFSYKARVISKGNFVAPPATISLMYNPEVYGRTTAEMIEISENSRIIELLNPFDSARRNRILVIFGIVLLTLLSILGVVATFFIKRFKAKKSTNTVTKVEEPINQNDLN